MSVRIIGQPKIGDRRVELEVRTNGITKRISYDLTNEVKSDSTARVGGEVHAKLLTSVAILFLNRHWSSYRKGFLKL